MILDFDEMQPICTHCKRDRYEERHELEKNKYCKDCYENGYKLCYICKYYKKFKHFNTTISKRGFKTVSRRCNECLSMKYRCNICCEDVLFIEMSKHILSDTHKNRLIFRNTNIVTDNSVCEICCISKNNLTLRCCDYKNKMCKNCYLKIIKDNNDTFKCPYCRHEIEFT